MNSSILTVGFYEYITINNHKILARIDTGALKSSLDKSLAKQLLGSLDIIEHIKVKNVHGITTRPVIKLKLKIQDKEFENNFNLMDRTNMKYKVLIGQDILKQGFIIDPQKEV